MARESRSGPTLRSWLVAGTVGSALALLFDGERGAHRRNTLRQKGSSLYGMVNGRLQKRTKLAAGSVYGNAAQALNMYEPDNPAPDDNTLRDRIESEVFGDPRTPKGEYNLNVADGIAVIRGQLKSQSDIQTLIQLIGAVPHVRGVESFLHTPGTDAPNKESAIHASDAS